MPFSRNRANVALKNEPETTKTWPEATAGRSPGPLSGFSFFANQGNVIKIQIFRRAYENNYSTLS